MKTRNWLGCMVFLGGLGLGLVAKAQNPIHVTYLWHMHQPIYFPYESVQETDNNNRFIYSVRGIHDERSGNYGDWVKNAVQQGADRNMPHAGVQVSFSGSLMENLRGVWGDGWRDHWRWGRNGLRTANDNPRLDLVGFAYHHSLMPLTTRESMIMQIRLHREAYADNWNTGGSYSKGFFPPESSFANHMIPALVSQGIEWVLVDNGHFDRTLNDFPWSAASSIKPNRSEQRNGSVADKNSEWTQLNNVWAPTRVAAPWSYQPHHVRYVDPWTGNVQKMIAVPSARYEGNENGRGGYGAFKPENVWGDHIAKNNNATKPMIIVAHSDGDNFGMKNADVYHGQHGLFLDMVQANQNFSHTTVQDYLDMYPPDQNDLIHVEPGSWVGIDGGTPYYDKWVEKNSRDGQHPDYWSWSVIVAAQNRVLHADDLENNYTMNDVRWGIGPDTAKAWRYFLQAETSCHWYWDYDTANPWDGNATRGANLAVGEANKVIARHAGVDRVGPSIFPPQRPVWNPGATHWSDTDVQPSDFPIWTFVDDVSGVAAVRLYWRTADWATWTDLNQIVHEIYAHTPGKNSPWNVEPMSGSWYPTSKGSNVPDPAARAMKYDATIAGQNNTLINYFVEAVDAMGNTNRSEIFHVWVGEPTDDGGSQGPRVEFEPAAPANCEPVTIKYRKAGSYFGTERPFIHIGRNGWQDVIVPNPQMEDGGDFWTYTYTPPTNTVELNIVFNNNAGLWDNNGGIDWNLAISGCGDDDGGGVQPGPAAWTVPEAPVGCDPVTIYYNPANRPLATAESVHIHVGHDDFQDVMPDNPAMTREGNNWTYTYTPPPGTRVIDFVFNNGGGTWDNNQSQDWHVNVTGCDGGEVQSVVSINPTNPVGCGPVTITYNPAARVLSTSGQVKIHIGHNGWDDVIEPNPSMVQVGSVWTYTYQPRPGTTNINLVFNDGADVWDNNGGLDWHFTVVNCDALPSGIVITNPASDVSTGATTIDLAGVASDVTGHLRWTNALTGASGVIPADTSWSIPGIALGDGANPITVSGTNAAPGGIMTNASDHAGNPAYAAQWNNASNGGTGFGEWTLNGVEGNAGHFVEASGWGMWSHETNHLAEAMRPLAAPLAVGQTFRVRMQNGYIWENGGSVGVALRDAEGNTVWELYFNGGQTNYNTPLGATDIPWTDAGLEVAFTQTGESTYSVIITPDGSDARTYSGAVAAPITEFRAWSYNNGTDDGQNSLRNLYINNLQIVSESAGGLVTRSASVTITRLPGHIDSNGDGVPDVWYGRYGVNHLTPNMAGQNTTGGGATYREAYLFDLDPRQPAPPDFNEVRGAGANGPVMQLMVPGPTSTNRQYDVFWSTNLFGGAWVPLNLNRPGHADQSPVTLTVTNGPANRFYRTGTKLP